MANSTISYLWRDTKAPQGFRSGSLAAQSHQSVVGIAGVSGQVWQAVSGDSSVDDGAGAEGRGKPRVQVNYTASYWTPPMTPKLAFDLESRQIENLDLAPMVSITDHDNIKAPMLLRTVPSARQIPVSVEWSAPYGNAVVSSGHAQSAQRRGDGVDGDAGGLIRPTRAKRG